MQLIVVRRVDSAQPFGNRSVGCGLSIELPKFLHLPATHQGVAQLGEQGFAIAPGDLALFDGLGQRRLLLFQQPLQLAAAVGQSHRERLQPLRQRPLGKAIFRFVGKPSRLLTQLIFEPAVILQQLIDGIGQPALLVAQGLILHGFGESIPKLGQFTEPLNAGGHGNLGRRLIAGYGWQVVGFIQYIDALIGARQDDATAERQIGQQQRVVDDQHIKLVEAGTGLMKRAALMLVKQGVADMTIGADGLPQLVIEGLGPAVPIAGPAALLIGLPQLLVALLLLGIRAEAQELIEAELIVLADRCRQLGQPLRAAVALAPFDEGEGERLRCEGLIQREIFANQLLLQSQGGGGEHQLLLELPGTGNGALGVGQRLADAGPGFGH